MASSNVSVEGSLMDVNSFLKHIGIPQYGEKLKSQGWDDLRFLSTQSPKELYNIGKSVEMLPGHLKKFATKLTGLRHKDKTHQPLPSIETSTVLSTATGTKTVTDTKAVTDTKTVTDTKNSHTFIAMIVDRSGSMHSVGNEAMNGFNTFVEQQQEASGKCSMTVARFDNSVEIIHDNIPIEAIPKADETTFKPRGMTALYDAIGTVIRHTEEWDVKESFTKIIVVILTDGEENGSMSFNRDSIRDLITRLSKNSKWEFLFMGANQDAILNGSSIGIQQQTCLTFTADPEHTRETFAALSNNCKRGRMDPLKRMAFTKLERCTTTDNPPVYPTSDNL